MVDKKVIEACVDKFAEEIDNGIGNVYELEWAEYEIDDMLDDYSELEDALGNAFDKTRRAKDLYLKAFQKALEKELK